MSCLGLLNCRIRNLDHNLVASPLLSGPCREALFLVRFFHLSESVERHQVGNFEFIPLERCGIRHCIISQIDFQLLVLMFVDCVYMPDKQGTLCALSHFRIFT